MAAADYDDVVSRGELHRAPKSRSGKTRILAVFQRDRQRSTWNSADRICNWGKVAQTFIRAGDGDPETQMFHVEHRARAHPKAFWSTRRCVNTPLTHPLSTSYAPRFH